MTTAGKRMIASAQEALEFVQGQSVAGTKVHIPHETDVSGGPGSSATRLPD